MFSFQENYRALGLWGSGRTLPSRRDYVSQQLFIRQVSDYAFHYLREQAFQRCIFFPTSESIVLS
ncbi:MAG: hypothetical protein H7Z75_14795 [Ferruginibacter sp.]|nr:hypothetical protein [Cytophagales bacterium]